MKNTIKFKAVLRIAGIIALVAIIGFSMAACGGGSTCDDDSNCSCNGSPGSTECSIAQNPFGGECKCTTKN